MDPTDVFKKRNFSKVNFDYEEMIGRNLSNSNLKGVDLKNICRLHLFFNECFTIMMFMTIFSLPHIVYGNICKINSII